MAVHLVNPVFALFLKQQNLQETMQLEIKKWNAQIKQQKYISKYMSLCQA